MAAVHNDNDDNDDNNNNNNNDNNDNDNDNNNNCQQKSEVTSASASVSVSASVRAAARGTLWSVGVKVVSFVATQWTFRFLQNDPSALGKASIQLELLLSTILFCTREGFRLVMTKPCHDFQIAWLSIPVGTIISMVALLIHLYYCTNTTTSSSSSNNNDYDDDNNEYDIDYMLAGVLYCVASWIESWAEPWVLWSLRNLHMTNKIKAEGVATLVKTMSLAILLPLLSSSSSPTATEYEYPITAFGISQLLYAITFFTVLLLYAHSTTSYRPPLPPRWKNNNKMPFFITACFQQQPSSTTTTLYLVFVFTIQGVFKHVLTEGDRIVLTSLSDHYHQGIYAMGSAYGGMAARLLLQPLEENGRLLWSKHPTPQSYTVLIHLVLHVGLLFATIAVNYTSLLLKILAGHTWGNNPEAALVLSAFCVYTAFLAWNGMTEAFVYAVVSSGSQVGTLGMAHVIVGGMFMAVAPMMVSQYGTVGLVVANCIAMGVRVCYSIYFASRYFCSSTTNNSSSNNNTKSKTTVLTMARWLLQDMVPPPAVLLAYGIAFVVTRSSMLRMKEYEMQQSRTEDGITNEWLLLAAQHVSVGLVSVLLVAMATIPFEKNFRRSLHSMFREKQE